ncbi:MAG: TolC family protein [Bacteroidota bacterium]
MKNQKIHSFLKGFFAIVGLSLLCSGLMAQSPEPLLIQIVSDDDGKNEESQDFENGLKEEIQVLLSNRRLVSFQTEYCKCLPAQINEKFEEAFANPAVDIVIALGPLSSAVLGQRPSFPKPSIASIVLDNELQNIPIDSTGASGISNFTYVQSPFSFEKDLRLLHQEYPYKKIGILTSPEVNGLFPRFGDLFAQTVGDLGADFSQIVVKQNASTTINLIPEDIDALYVFPLFDELKPLEQAAFFKLLAEKKLPSVALLGESMVEQGAMLGYQNEGNLQKMPRRIALNISRMVDGQNAAELPVVIRTFGESVVINMSTVRQVGTYPNWDLMTGAILYNADQMETDRKLSLQTVIMEALDRNLSLKVAGVDPILAAKETGLAKAELLPSVSANGSLLALDENTVQNSFGSRGRLNLAVGAELSQLVYAEPALAGVAIQKLLQKGEQFGLETVQLDVTLDAASLYLNVLQAKSFMDVQAANLSVTRNNLDIARAKDAVGYTGATDLNRWKSELALGKIDLNDAQAQLEQAKYALNQYLNRPIDEAFEMEDIGVANDLLLVNDERLISRINNEKELSQLADFLVKEALARLPELRQIDYGLAAQERLLKSRKRAFYLPSFALTGTLDQTLQRWNNMPLDGFPVPDLVPTWNVGLGVQYPIFQGNKRKLDKEITELNILQIKDNRLNTKNQLELRVRSSLQKASASYFRVLQFVEATKAADDNFKIVQDSYSQGLVSVTNLIDAQNAKVQTDLGAVNASYQYILDFLEMERAVGFYYLLATAGERNAFFDRFNAHMVE